MKVTRLIRFEIATTPGDDEEHGNLILKVEPLFKRDSFESAKDLQHFVLTASLAKTVNFLWNLICELTMKWQAPAILSEFADMASKEEEE